ncbi:probable urease-associated protein [Roseobacter sp. CCS2]|nr:probable urease-associated protein [Roseobacter sp. CCS2]
MYLFAGTVGGLIKTGDPSVQTSEFRIGLLRGPIHTDLLLPAIPEIRTAFGFLQEGGLPVTHPDVAWIVAGWGAREFYMTTGSYADLRPGPVWRAISGDDAVMRVFVGGEITDPVAITWVNVSLDQLDALTRAVLFDFENTSLPPLDHPGLNGSDLFYPAKGRFHLFRTCNVWVGDMLRQAGIRVGIWTPFTWSLP